MNINDKVLKIFFNVSILILNMRKNFFLNIHIHYFKEILFINNFIDFYSRDLSEWLYFLTDYVIGDWFLPILIQFSLKIN